MTLHSSTHGSFAVLSRPGPSHVRLLDLQTCPTLQIVQQLLTVLLEPCDCISRALFLCRWAPAGLASQSSTSQSAPPKPVSGAVASSSGQPASSATPSSSEWQTVKTSGARAKGRGHPGGPPKDPSNRAAAAYASASPLDFQEPWRDEPEPSSQSRHSIKSHRQQQQRQAVAPAVSKDELPEDWEEAASAAQSSEGGREHAVEAAQEAASTAEAAHTEAAVTEEAAQQGASPEAAFTEAAQRAASPQAAQQAGSTEVAQEGDADDESMGDADDESMGGSTMGECTVMAAVLTDTDGTQRALDAPARIHQAEAATAAAPPPAGNVTDEAKAAAVSAPAPAVCPTDEATAEAFTFDDGDQEAGTADDWQEGVPAQGLDLEC